jgi:hypothetical protein
MRRPTRLDLVLLRSIVGLIFVVGMEFGYITWLHSDYFPQWLLFP